MEIAKLASLALENLVTTPDLRRRGCYRMIPDPGGAGHMVGRGLAAGARQAEFGTKWLVRELHPSTSRPAQVPGRQGDRRRYQGRGEKWQNDVSGHHEQRADKSASQDGRKGHYAPANPGPFPPARRLSVKVAVISWVNVVVVRSGTASLRAVAV